MTVHPHPGRRRLILVVLAAASAASCTAAPPPAHPPGELYISPPTPPRTAPSTENDPNGGAS